MLVFAALVVVAFIAQRWSTRRLTESTRRNLERSAAARAARRHHLAVARQAEEYRKSGALR